MAGMGTFSKGRKMGAFGMVEFFGIAAMVVFRNFNYNKNLRVQNKVIFTPFSLKKNYYKVFRFVQTHKLFWKKLSCLSLTN